MERSLDQVTRGGYTRRQLLVRTGILALGAVSVSPEVCRRLIPPTTASLQIGYRHLPQNLYEGWVSVDKKYFEEREHLQVEEMSYERDFLLHVYMQRFGRDIAITASLGDGRYDTEPRDIWETVARQVDFNRRNVLGMKWKISGDEKTFQGLWWNLKPLPELGRLPQVNT